MPIVNEDGENEYDDGFDNDDDSNDDDYSYGYDSPGHNKTYINDNVNCLCHKWRRFKVFILFLLENLVEGTKRIHFLHLGSIWA